MTIPDPQANGLPAAADAAGQADAHDRARDGSDAQGAQPLRATDRITQYLAGEIASGAIKPGERLPSSRTLAAQVGASINTVQAALARLEATGQIICRPRRRAIVSPSPAGGSPRRQGMIYLFTEPGALYADFATSWGAQILFAAEHVLATHDLTAAKVYVPTVNRQIPPHELAKIEAMLESAAAVIWLASAGLQGPILAAIQRGVPTVTVNAPHDIVHCNLVKADNVGGGRIVGRVFAELGYHRCLLLTRGLQYRRFAPELAQGFLDSLMKMGVPLRGIDYRDFAYDEAHRAGEIVSEYLRSNPTPQGIFAVDDRLALAAMQACQDHGLDVPGDVGIVSGIGFEPCRKARPAISAWTQPTQRLGEEAARMLLHLIDHPGDRLPPLEVPSTLTLRGSLPHHERLLDVPGVEAP